MRASQGATFLFAAGTHTLTQSLKVTKDGITFRGEADGGTKLQLAQNVTGTGISFSGNVDKSYTSKLAAAVLKDSTLITVANANGLKAGDIIRISQSNDDAFIKANYPNILGDPALAANPLRESVAEIISISGNTLTLKQAIAYDMSAGHQTTIERLSMLENVGMHDLTLTYALGKADPNNFANTKPAFKDSDAIVFNYTKGAEISNIKVVDAASTALEVRNALDAHVDNLFVAGAHNKDAANGYGLHIAGSTNGTFENLTIVDVRHAVLFSSWNAEVGNTVHVSYTNRDINYHGSDDYGNVVIVDRAEYQEGNDTWALVSPGGKGHPATDIDANTTLFGYAVGGSKNEKLYGSHDGSTLFGMAGNDTLIGGKLTDTLNGGVGNDILSGGKGADILTGGAGRDTFVVARQGGVDTITDFTAGKGGDQIVVAAFGDKKSFADLQFEQRGADVYLNLGLADGVLIKNASMASLTAENFLFDPDYVTDLEFSLTREKDTVTGGHGNDLVIAASRTLRAGDIIEAGKGLDTLKVEGASASIDLRSIKMSGVEVLDVSGARVSRLAFSDGSVASSDTGGIIVKYGDNGIRNLNTSAVSDQYDVILKGAGANIALANNNGNRIILENTAAVTLRGGKGDDVILLKGVGSLIDAGRGDDVIMGGVGVDIITGGAGHDTFVYETASQFGDTIRDFSAILESQDKLDLTVLFEANGLGDKSYATALAGGFLQLTQQNTSTLVSFDRDGHAGTAHRSEAIAILEKTMASSLTETTILI